MNRYDFALFFALLGTGPRAGRGGGYTPIIHKTAIGDGARRLGEDHAPLVLYSIAGPGGIDPRRGTLSCRAENRDAIPDAVPVLVLLDKKDDMAYLGSKSNSCLE